MAIPSLPQYTDYTLERSLEHPDCYVGLYYQTSSYQISTPHNVRVATFNKSTLVELDTVVYSVGNEYDHFSGSFISAQDSILWSAMINEGFWSWSLDGGIITKIADIPKHSGSYTISITEAGDNIWTADYSGAVYVHDKTGYGTVNGTPIYTHTNVSESNQFNLLSYCPDVDVVVARLHNGGGWNVSESLNATTFSLIDTFSTQSLAVFGGITTYVDADTRAEFQNFLSYTRDGEPRKIYLNNDGTFGTIENYNPNAGDTYEDLIAAKNVFAWYDFNEDDANTKILDRSGNARDMTIVGSFTRVSSIYANSVDNKALQLPTTGEAKWDATAEFHAPTSAYEFWLTVQAYPTPNNSAILTMTDATTSGNGYGAVLLTDGRIHFGKWDGSSQSFTSRKLALNIPYHIVMQQTTLGMEVWVNGHKLESNGSTTDHLSSGTYYTTFWINKTSATSVSSCAFTVDSLIMYDDNLTKQDILDRYNATSSTPLTETYRERILNLEPIAYYPMDDLSNGLKDISGNEEHATLVSGTATYDSSGGLVDGDNCISLPDANNTAFRSDNTFPLTTKMSIEFWGKKIADHVGGDTFDIWCCLRNQATSNVQYVGFDYINKHTILQSRDSLSVSTLQEVWNEIAKLGEWFHVAVTIDDTTDEGKLYINGSLVSTCPTKPMEANPYLFIGNYADTSASGPYGYMQHLSLYDKILTPQEIADNYNLGRGHTPTAVNAYEQVVIDDDPMCYFPLDETTGTTVTDRMGRAIGTLSGGSADTMTTTGLITGDSQPCLSFNGTDQYITVEGSQLLGSFTSITVEAIISSDVVNATTKKFIAPAENGGYQMNLDNSNVLKAYFYLNNSGAFQQALDSNPMVANKIYHYCGVFDGRYIRLYLNGEMINEFDSGSTTYIDYTTFLNFTIGAEYNSGGNSGFWDGKIAHVAVYDKALTQTQIINHSNFALGYNASDLYNTIIADSPVKYYPMQDGVSQKTFREVISGANLVGQGNSIQSSQSLLTGDVDDRSFAYDGLTAGEYTLDWVGTIANNADFSIEVMVQANVLTSGTDPIIEFTTPGGTTEGVMLYKSDTGFGVRISDTGVNNLYTTNKNIIDEPVHLVLTYKSGVGYKYYINGRVILDEADLVQTTSTINDADRFRVGYNVAGEYFDGNVSHLAFYDFVLSDAQVSNHYHASHGDVDSTYRNTIKALNPIHYYRCDDVLGSATLRDESNFPIDGTVTGGTFEASGAIASDTNNVGLYLGSGELVELDQAGLVPYVGDWTIEVWCKVVSGNTVVLSQGRDTFGAGWSISISINSGTFTISIVTTSPTTTERTFTWNANTLSGAWNHIVFVWEESVGMRGYINGHDCGLISDTTTNLRNSTKGFFVGETNNGVNTDLGYYDEIAIYDKVLTHTNIINNYTIGKDKVGSYEEKIITSAPITRWLLDDATSDIDDVFGNADYLTLNTTPNGLALHKDSSGSMLFPGDANDGGRHTAGILASRTTWSIETWIQMNDISADGDYIYTESASGGVVLQFMVSTGNLLSCNFHDGTDWADAVIGVVAIPTNTPLHLVWVRNGITSTIYVNGKVYVTGSHGGTRGANALGASIYSAIGNNAATNQTFNAFDGYIDDVCIYHDILTQQEIEDHYYKGVISQSSVGEYINSLSPSFYCKFNKLTFGGGVQDEFGLIGSATSSIVLDSEQSALRDGSFRIPDDNYVDFPHQTFLDISSNDTFTQMLWVKFDGSTGVSQRIVDWRGTGSIGTVSGFQLATSPSSVGGLNNTFVDDGSGNYARISTTDYGLFDGNWHHVAITWNGTTQELKLYIDSIFKETATVTGTVGAISSTLPIRFGRAANDNTTEDFSGYVDEAIFFTSELTSNDILTIYNQSTARYKIDGYVTEDGNPVQRKVRIYNRLTGELVYDTTSNIGGIFTMDFKEYDQNEYYAVALDDDDIDVLDAIVHDRLTGDTI